MRSEQLSSYLTKFTATITAVFTDDRGTWLTLSDSLFYPESGGQPADTGTLGDTPVLDVILVGEERRHLVAAPTTLAVGDTVLGVVDWNRRFVHMQRHTAQHLVSEALLRCNPLFDTVSVSLRGPNITIEIAHEPTAEELQRVFTEANDVARSDPPVFAFTVTQAELQRYQLRRPAPDVPEVRLIAIGDYDLSACGGTHVRQLAEVLPIVFLSTERVRGDHCRIVFQAGQEAANLAATSVAALTQASAALSSARSEVPARVTQLLHDMKTSQVEVQQWQQRFAEAIAAQYEPGVADAPAVIVCTLDEHTGPALSHVGRAFAARPHTVALLAAPAGERTNVLFASSPNVELGLQSVFHALLDQHDGRGGGRPDWLQGAVSTDTATMKAALTALREQLTM